MSTQDAPMAHTDTGPYLPPSLDDVALTDYCTRQADVDDAEEEERLPPPPPPPQPIETFPKLDFTSWGRRSSIMSTGACSFRIGVDATGDTSEVGAEMSAFPAVA